MSVGNSSKHSRNAFLRIDLIQVKILGSAINGLEAVGLDWTASTRLDAAVGLEDVGNGSTAVVCLTL